LLATDQGDAVQIYETRTAKRLAAAMRMAGRIREIHFSPDGKRLAIAADRGAEGVVEVRTVASGARVGQPLLLRDHVGGLDFSRDGRSLATACDDHTARVWDAGTGEPVSPWLTHAYETRQVVFSPDGTRLVTLSRRGAVRLWNARTGEPITAPILYERNIGNGRVAYSPDGGRLLIARGGNEAFIRELRPETARLEDLKLLAEALTCTRFDPATGLVPLGEAALNEACRQLRALRAGTDSKSAAIFR
jgi:dipeptidyl aminopeptidase/acylaminoacyl peptidase